MSADDRLQILELPSRYSYAWDSADVDAYAALFTEDAIFQLQRAGESEPSLSLVGREEIRSWATARHAIPTARWQTRAHAGGTIIEEFTPNRASGRTMLLQTIAEVSEAVLRPTVSGIYREEWQRTAEGWRFSSRVLRLDVV